MKSKMGNVLMILITV